MVTTTSIFVDKTLFIKEIIDRTYPNILITRPRRWGKTLNLHMLKVFLSIQVDINGNTITPQPKRYLFQGISQNQSPIKQKRLKIALQNQWHNKYSLHQGQYPVIFLSFKDLCNQSFQLFYQNFVHYISKVCQNYRYLLNKKVQQISIEMIEQFQKLLSQSGSRTQVQHSLKLLTQLLKVFHKKKCIVLIDQYDAPFKNLMINQGSKDQNAQKVKITNLINNFLSRGLKGNSDFLQKSISCGVFNFFLKQTISGLNNIFTAGCFDSQFSTHFGFSYQQIEQQLIKRMFKTKAKADSIKILKIIKQWYNGYLIRQNSNEIQSYNPYSVINYLDSVRQYKKIVPGKQYWAYSKADIFVKQIINKQKQQQLLGKIFSLIQAFNKIESNEIILKYQVNSDLNKFVSGKNIKEQDLTYLLINIGFLTGRYYKQNEKLVVAKIPNIEIFLCLRKIFQDWLQQNQLIEQSNIDINQPKDLADNMLRTWKKINNYLGQKNQKIFNSLFAIRYLLSKDKTHKVSAQVYSGYGYIDNIFQPLNSPGNIIIHQYKYTTKSSQKKDILNQGFWQIYEKNYMKQFRYLRLK